MNTEQQSFFDRSKENIFESVGINQEKFDKWVEILDKAYAKHSNIYDSVQELTESDVFDITDPKHTFVLGVMIFHIWQDR